MQARMRVTYVRDARAERTSPSSDTRPAHVHAGKGPENARRRQPRRTGRNTGRNDAITTEPRPPMLIGRLQRGARSPLVRQGNRTINSKNRSAKKKNREDGDDMHPHSSAGWTGHAGESVGAVRGRGSHQSPKHCVRQVRCCTSPCAVALCTLSARRCVPREADDPGCSGTATAQDSQHVPLRCGARRVQRSPRTRRAVLAGCTMVQTCCDRLQHVSACFRPVPASRAMLQPTCSVPHHITAGANRVPQAQPPDVPKRAARSSARTGPSAGGLTVSAVQVHPRRLRRNGKTTFWTTAKGGRRRRVSVKAASAPTGT